MPRAGHEGRARNPQRQWLSLGSDRQVSETASRACGQGSEAWELLRVSRQTCGRHSSDFDSFSTRIEADAGAFGCGQRWLHN